MSITSSNRITDDECRSVGRFRLRDVLGEGAFGRVYLADDPLLGRQVALKLLAEEGGDSKSAARFLREGKAAAQLRHPHLVPVFEAGQVEGQLYLASEYVAGTSLARTLLAERPNPRQAAEWCRQLADALGYAHDEGVIHRDVKPDNILVDERGEVRLTDFGLAKRLDDDATVTTEGELLGSPAYMSPEQARGEPEAIGPASDQYSLGVVLYELLTGCTPFIGPSHLMIADVLQTAPPRPRTCDRRIPRALETICLKCLSKSAAERYESCHALARDLTLWLNGESIAARLSPWWERAARWMRRNPRIAALEAAVAGLLLTVTTVAFVIAATLASDRESIRQALTIASNERQREQEQAALADREQQRANVAEREAEQQALSARNAADQATVLLQRLRDEERQAALVRQQQSAAVTQLATVQSSAEQEATTLQQTQAKRDLVMKSIRADLADDTPHQRYIKLLKLASAAAGELRWITIGGQPDVKLGKLASSQVIAQVRALLDECPAEHRGWEWHYLAGCCRPEFDGVWEFKADGIEIGREREFTISNDGRWLVCLTSTRPVVVDLLNRRRNAPVEAPPTDAINPDPKIDPRELKTVVVSHDSRLVAAVIGKALTVWELSSGKMVQHRHEPDRQILAAGFDSQGRLLIASATEVPKDKDGQIQPASRLPGPLVSNGLTGEPLSKETSRVAKAIQQTKCFPCEFSPDGSQLLLVGRPQDKFKVNNDSGTVVSLETGAAYAPFRATQIRFGVGDSGLLCMRRTKLDGRDFHGWMLMPFDLKLEKPLLAKHPLQVSPTADRVIDRTGIWDLKTQTVILPLENPNAEIFEWSADGQSIVVGFGGRIRVYTALPSAASKIPPP